MTLLNEHLEHHVQQRLLADASLSSYRIEVVADEGVVTLRGNVQSFRRKLAAQEIASSVEGVDSIRNELEVAKVLPCPDSEICAAVNLHLDTRETVAGETIRVSARDGVVNLTGYVETELERSRVIDFVASVDGVIGVSDFLIVNPDQVRTNRIHCKTILDSLGNIVGIHPHSIRLAVVDETARLSGSVDALWKKEAAEKVVRQYGVLNVANEIGVTP